MDSNTDSAEFTELKPQTFRRNTTKYAIGPNGYFGEAREAQN